MRQFFRGWRRKVGCVTLVTACLLLAAWVRNHFYADDLQMTITDTSEIAAYSMYDSVQIIYRTHPSYREMLPTQPPWFLYGNRPVTRHDRGMWDPWRSDVAPANEIHVDLATPLFRFLKMTYGDVVPFRARNVTTVVLSDLPASFLLTLLSAWLLLSKPRVAKKTVEPGPAEGP